MGFRKIISVILGNHLPEAAQNDNINQIVPRYVLNSLKQPTVSKLGYFFRFSPLRGTNL